MEAARPAAHVAPAAVDGGGIVTASNQRRLRIKRFGQVEKKERLPGRLKILRPGKRSPVFVASVVHML